MLPRKLVRRPFSLLLADNICAICAAARLRPLQIVRNKTSTPKRKSGTSHWDQAPTSRQRQDRFRRMPKEKTPEELVLPQLDPLSAHKMDKAKAQSQPINADVLGSAHRAGFLKISGDKSQKFMQMFWDMGAEPHEQQLQNACHCKMQPAQVTWPCR
jgi:hypothetical protein